MIAAADCRNAAGTSRYSFIWASPIAWLNSLSLVNNDGYYLTTAQKTKDNVFFNGTNVYPISFALAGAGMIAYAGESPQQLLLHLQLHNFDFHTFMADCIPQTMLEQHGMVNTCI